MQTLAKKTLKTHTTGMRGFTAHTVQTDERKIRDWHAISDEEVLGRAQSIIDKEKISDWKEFSAKYAGIRLEIFRRALQRDDLDFCRRKRKTKDWAVISDEEVLRRAQHAIDRERFSDWKAFSAKYAGIRLEIFRRALQRDDLVFSTG